MVRRRVVSFAVVALSTAVASACSASVTPSPAPPLGTVTVVGTEMAFTPNTLQWRSGTWNVHFENHGAVFHDLSIEPLNGKKVIAATAAQPGQSGDLTVTLGRGEYLMVCLEPGHRQAGMVGTISVR